MIFRKMLSLKFVSIWVGAKDIQKSIIVRMRACFVDMILCYTKKTAALN
jgi:hypothetical protein